MVAVNINNRDGRYALTVGTRYQILNHSRGVITLRNDNNLRASYSESLFNIIEEETDVAAVVQRQGARVTLEDITPEPEPEPIPEPVRTPFTDQMVCDSVNIQVLLDNDNNIIISTSFNTKEFVEDEDRIVNLGQVEMNLAGSFISCGVHQISGIRALTRLPEGIDYQLRDFEGLVDTIFNKIKEAWDNTDVSGLGCAIYLASDVYTVERERLMGLLGFENVTGIPVINRNSTNPIVVYQKCREEDRVVIDNEDNN